MKNEHVRLFMDFTYAVMIRKYCFNKNAKAIFIFMLAESNSCDISYLLWITDLCGWEIKTFKFSCRHRQIGGSVGKYDYRLFHAWFRLRTANSRQFPIYIQIRFSLPHFFGRWECVDASNWRVDLTSFLITLDDDKLSYKPRMGVFFSKMVMN